MRYRAVGIAATLGLVVYDTTVRRRMLEWGSMPEERTMPLPGDEIIEEVMTHRTRAVTIDAPPEAVWPWLVQMGEARGGWYSYDWIENWLFFGTVHRADGRRSATRIHPEFQDLQVGDHVDTATLRGMRVGAAVTTCEANQALVIGSWAFVLVPLPGGRTRFLNRERESGWIRRLAPRRSGVLRALAGLADYAIGEPLHFAMVRRMMLGIKARGEASLEVQAPAVGHGGFSPAEEALVRWGCRWAVALPGASPPRRHSSH
ncbi:MAG TPA: hypothetical protein VFH70_13255 [Acidimicrobiales bacterium]|nr:hypothetical protein [Acidimicrobiales bacterium]